MTADAKTLQERFRLTVLPPNIKPRYNIAPSQDAPVVILQDDQRRLEMFHWGLIPAWSQTKKVPYSLINAKSETLLEKPTYSRPFKKSRCLIPCSGFYEWLAQKDVKAKIPMHIGLKSGEPFALAGIWDTWKDPSGGELRSFSILTTTPNSLCERIHNRMPVLVPRKDEDAWLDPAAEVANLVKLLKPYPEKEMTVYEVSVLVNSPKNDTPKCIEKVGA